MATTTQINITAKDSTAGAFASADKNLSSLSSSAVQAAAAIAGIGVSFGGLASSIKSSIDTADETLKLSQKIGVAVEQIAGLELAFKQSGLGADQLQSSISKLSKNVASGSAAFDAMGVATRGADGNLKSTREILGEVSDKFAGYQDGIAKTALAIELFGKSGADVIPFLNQGAESLAEFDAMAEKLGLTLSTSTAKKAEEFNDTLSLIGQSFKGVSTRIAAEMLPTLQGLAEQFFNTATQGNNIKVVADAVTTTFKGLVAGGLAAAGAFKTVGTTLGGVAAMWAAIASGEFSQASTIVKQIKADFSDNFKSTIDNVTNAWNANGSATVEALTATQKQVQIQAPLTSELEKSTKSIEKQSKALNFQVGNLKELQAIYSRVQSITKSVETDQERYNDTLIELERLKPYLGAETYSRALQKAQDELNKTSEVTKVTTDEVSQLWMQAGRNIQSTLANSIFNFFDDGLKGMLKNVVSTIGRIASEFAALKIAQGIGLAGMFGASGAANASSGGGLNLLNIASLGSSVMSGIRGGFGIPNAIGNMGMSLPGSIGSFFGGMAGSTGTQAAAEAGAMALWGSSGASAGIASGMGAGLAAAAGPLMVAFAATQAFKMLAGDKRLGGGFGKAMNFVGDIPILGDLIPIIPLINGLFGRGPMKQQGTLLEGRIGAEGFESGMLQTRFKAKGGLFRSDKIDYSRVDAVTGETFTDNGKLRGFTEELAKAGAQLFGVINDATKQTSSTLRGVAKDLGLATGGIDDFSYSISILTDKGKMLTEEQVGEEIGKISEAMARKLLPTVDDFAKRGETALQTVSRLGAEFTALSDGAVNLGASAAYAKELISGMSIEARTAFVDMAGGIENIKTLTGYFAQNYLTPAERIAPLIEGLTTAAKELGFAYTTDVTKEQVKALIQSKEITAETRLGLLTLLPTFDTVRNTLDALSGATGTGADDLDKFNQSVKDAGDVAREAVRELNIRNADETEYGQRLNKGISETTQAIAELEGIASRLAGTVNSINPLSTDQARAIVSKGDPYDPNLQNALSVLSTSSANDFSSKLDLQRSKALNIGAINSLQNSVAANISAAEARKSQFEFEKQMLQISLQNAAVMFKTLTEASKTAEILDRVTAGGGAMLVESV